MSHPARLRGAAGRTTRNSHANSEDGGRDAVEGPSDGPSRTQSGPEEPDLGAGATAARETPAPSMRDSEEPHEDSVVDPGQAIAERNAFLIARVREARLQRQNELLEAELAGITTEEVVPIDGVLVPIRTQGAGEKYRSSDSAFDQISAMKRMQGPAARFAGKDLKELQEYEVKWLNKFSSSEMGGTYASMPDASRVALASGSLDGLAAYQWSRKTPVEQRSYSTWAGYMSYLRTLVADPENRLAAATLALKDCQQKSGQSARELQQHIDELEGDIPKEITEEQRRGYQLLNSLRPALRTHVLRQQEKITSVENVLVIASRHEQLSALNTSHREDIDRSRPLSSKVSSKRSAGSSHGGRTREWVSEKTREVQKRPVTDVKTNDGKCWNCGTAGHISAECRKPRRTQEAHVSMVTAPPDQKGKQKEPYKPKNLKPTL